MSTDMSAVGSVPLWTIADRVRKAREHAGLSQDELAERSGVARTSVSNYERGATAPRRPQLLALAMATGVPAVWLQTGEAPHPDPDGAPRSKYTAWDSNPEPADYVSNLARLPHRRARIAA